MKDLVAASGLHFDAAKRLRADLEDAGLIHIDETLVTGARSEMAITLTPLGREVAAHAASIQDLFAAARAQKDGTEGAKRSTNASQFARTMLSRAVAEKRRRGGQKPEEKED